MTQDETMFLHSKRRHPLKSTIHHWQLRDLISASTSDPNIVYFVHGETINGYNLKSKSKFLVHRLSFPPACFTIAHGFLAAGGTNSQLVVKDLNEDVELFNSSTGGSINNACFIAQYDHLCGNGNNNNNNNTSSSGTNTLSLFVSNNDNTIKVFSLPQVDHVCDIQVGVSVNYCSLNSNSTMLACVGDDTFVRLYDASQRPSFKSVANFKDCGFCCAFNVEGTLLAAASQDGTLCVWDLVSRQLVFKQKSSQKNGTGAIRSLKFSPIPGMDLLVFAEHENTVHVVDCREFKRYQLIPVASTIPALSDRQHIAGIAFSCDGKRLFIGQTSELVEFAVNVREQVSFAFGNLA